MIPFRHPHTRIFLGPPGTGKTQTLITHLEAELDAGLQPHEVGFFSFSNRATDEARERVMAHFGWSVDDLPFFSTLHSYARRRGSTGRREVVQAGSAAMREFARRIGEPMTNRDATDDELSRSQNPGDLMLFCDQLARARCVGLYEQWLDLALEDRVSWQRQLRFSEEYRRFKAREAVVDFQDMLDDFTLDGAPAELRVVFCDEGQDLSRSQWRALNLACAPAQRVYVAGDDDQCIYSWNGADVETFIALEGEASVLELSHRLPRRVHRVATRVLERIGRRRSKSFRPRDEEGVARLVRDHRDCDLTRDTWLLLARTNYLLHELEYYLQQRGLAYRGGRFSKRKRKLREVISIWEALRAGESLPAGEAKRILELMDAGVTAEGRRRLRAVEDRVPVTLRDARELGVGTTEAWPRALDRINRHDRSYLQLVERRGEDLEQPRITLSTIHGAKGGQADHVLLLPDVPSATHRSAWTDDDHRVFYVGVTRAFRSLQVAAPHGPHYDLRH